MSRCATCRANVGSCYVILMTVVGMLGACSRGTSTTAGSAAAETVRSAQPDTITVSRMSAVALDQFPALDVRTGCSETKLRTGYAVVSWGGPLTVDSPLRIDVAADKRGFERGEFVTAAPAASGASFTPASARLLGKPVSRPLDITIATAEDARIAKATLQQNRAVVIERLEPGVNYFIRVAARSGDHWVPGPTLQVEAPTCTADMRNPQ
jgi:hypothetical protein